MSRKKASSGKKYPEDKIEDKETEEEGLEMLKDAICSLGLNEGEVESAVKLNQGDIDLEERLDMVEMGPERADELEVLSRQQMSLETELHELWNKDRSLIESKGTEMSNLLSELEDIEEENARIEKKIREERRELLVREIKENKEKLTKLLN